MNEHIMPKSQPLVYNGVQIAAKAESMSLTDMWKAAKSPVNKEPWNWSRKEGAAFVEAVSLSHNLTVGQVMTTKKGKGGGTFAHWQIGLAYAKYLSPEFHMWCNSVVRERMEGKSLSIASLDPEIVEMIRRDDGISRMLAHKVTGIEATVQLLAASVTALASVAQPPGNGVYVSGKTSGEIWAEFGLPENMKNGPRWLGNRLEEMGCMLEHGRMLRIGRTRYRMFDHDKAVMCMKNGLLHKAKVYASERMGQKRLRLVSGEGA